MLINTKFRTNQPEIMDDFSLEGEELREALDKIAKINQLLGGNKLTLNGLKKILATHSKDNYFTIVDLGCGNGDMLRKIADFGTINGYKFKLIGIDANAYTINHAKHLSDNYDNIEYVCADVFIIDASKLNCDVMLCTLTLHHFTETEILFILNRFKTVAKLGIVVNDLQRSAVAYRLFQLLCVLFSLNRMSREDGLVSILRGFKKQELVTFSKKLDLKNYNIQWKWAFRYQWIIRNI